MTKRLNWLSIVDIVVPPHNRCRDMLAAPSPTSVVASCHAAACGAALTTLKSFKVIKDLKVPNDFFSQITENEKRRTGSALYVSTGRGKPNQQYNTKPAPAKAVRLVFAISVWKSLVRPRRDAGRMQNYEHVASFYLPLITNFHVRTNGKCTPLFSGLQCKDSTKRRDCKLLGGIFVRGSKTAPELFKDFNDLKVLRVCRRHCRRQGTGQCRRTRSRQLGGCGKVSAGAVSRR